MARRLLLAVTVTRSYCSLSGPARPSNGGPPAAYADSDRRRPRRGRRGPGLAVPVPVLVARGPGLPWALRLPHALPVVLPVAHCSGILRLQRHQRHGNLNFKLRFKLNGCY